MARGADPIARNARFAIATQVTTSALTGLLTLYLVRTLSLTDYGLFAVALAFCTIVVQPLDLGISSSTARFVAARREDRAATRSVLAEGARLKLRTVVPLCIVLLVLARPIATAYGLPDLVWPLRAMAVAVLAQSVLIFASAAFVALGRISLQFGVVVVESVVETATTIALVMAGGGVAGATLGRAAGFLCGAAAGALVLTAMFGRVVVRGARRSPRQARQIAGYARPFVVIDAAYTLISQIDVLLMGAYLSVAQVALFQAPMRLAVLLHYPGLAIANAVAPRVGDRDARRDPVALQRAVRLLLIFQGILIAPMVVWAAPLAAVAFGASYGASAGIIRGLVPYVFLSGLAPILSVSLDFRGEARRRVPIVLAAAGVNVVADLILIPRMGVMGGVIGTDLAFALYVPAHFAVCSRRLGLQVAPLAWTLLRTLIAASAMAAVLAAAGTSAALGMTGWILGSIGGVAAFGAGLLATRELTVGELRRLVPRVVLHRAVRHAG